MSNLDGVSVLVTGGRGFLGEFVCGALESRGAKVTSVSRRDGYDLRHPEDVVRAFMEFKPKVVVHLATEKGLKPSEVFSHNLRMATNVLEVSALSGAHFIFVAGYLRCGSAHPVGSVETALLAMRQIYQDHHSFSSTFFLAEQLYGVGADLHGLLPLVGQALHAAKNESLKRVEFTLSEEYPTPLLHAYDVSKAIVEAVEHGGKNKVGTHVMVTLASKEPATLFSEVVERLRSRVGYEGEISYSLGTHKTMEPLSGNDANRFLGWEPEVTVEMGVEETVGWLSRGASK